MPEQLTLLHRWEIIVAGIATLAIFSFLYRENSVYRFFEHLFIGIATSIGTMAVIKSFLWPQVLKPLLGYDRVLFPDGTYDAPYNKFNLLFLLPMAFGSLYYFIYVRRLSWLAQLVIGFSLGVGGGLAFQGTFNEMLPQVYDSFRPLYVPGDMATTVNNIVFVITMLLTFHYFFFTIRPRSGAGGRWLGGSSRWLMMCCFGAFFGATIMARMALLVERLEFLINEWLPALWT